jgi:hypothetical protein
LSNSEFSYADIIDVIREVLDSDGEIKIQPHGTSMLPLIVQGRDSVVLRKPKKIKKHDIIFYRRDNGQFVLHRVMKKSSDGTFVLLGDSQTEFEYDIKEEQIIAYVCRIERKGKVLKITSLSYRFYVFLWTKMPIRRVLCFVGRKVAFLRKKV